ncbi:MAG: Histidine--tRNA ligase [Bacteroidota bacterium]|jgi:histidyl-tRNA synthetase
MQKPSNARGTRDFGPKDMAKRNYVFDIIKKHFVEFGFQAIETPSIENLSTLNGKYGEEGDQLLFKILNSGDYLKDISSEDLTAGSRKTLAKLSEKGLRYDLTVPFARFVSMNRNELAFPFRRYQIQPVWRADRPQKGRYREFYQCDADIIGSDSLVNEAELIALFQSVFSSLSLKANLLINSRKVLMGMVDSLGLQNQFVDFAVALDKLDKVGWDAVVNELTEKGFSSQQCVAIKSMVSFQGTNQEKIAYLSTYFKDSVVGQQGLEEINAVLNLSETNGFSNDNLIFEITLARGLSYYTGLIYEGKAKDVAFGSIVGGGRYDDLTSSFSLPNMSGVGISFGIERILDVMETLDLFPILNASASQILFTYFSVEGQKQAFTYCNILRKEGIKAEVYPDVTKIKKSFEFADKKEIPFVAVLGDDELLNKQISLKDMKKGDQQLISISKLIDLLKV